MRTIRKPPEQKLSICLVRFVTCPLLTVTPFGPASQMVLRENLLSNKISRRQKNSETNRFKSRPNNDRNRLVSFRCQIREIGWTLFTRKSPPILRFRKLIRMKSGEWEPSGSITDVNQPFRQPGVAHTLETRERKPVLSRFPLS